jgi:hypothetical protein
MINKKLLLLFIGLIMTTQMIFSQVPSYVPTNGLVGYWPFNGNANDESGNGNNGTTNGTTLTTDRFGNANSAYNFVSANNNYITINNTIGNFGTSDFTISVWYLSTNQNSSHLLNKRFDQDFGNWWEITKYLFGINENDDNSNYGVINNTQLQLDYTWYNIIVTRSGTSLKYYIDGVLFQSTTTSIVHNISNSNNLVIGSVITPFSGVLQSHDGKIDDIGIWNRALTQQEITNMYNGVNYSDTCNAVSGSLVNGLVAYYPFCGNANDQSGNGLNGVVNGAILTTDRFGNSNSAYHFDGFDDVISANVNLPQNVTVSCWIKSEFTTNEFPTFFDFQLSTTNFHWIFYGQAAYNTQIGSRYVTLDNTSSPIFCDNVNLNGLLLNNWQFVTVVVDSATNKHKLYVNGALTNENTIQGTPQIADLIEFGRTGQSANHETNFYGSIDDIGIWNRVLTQQEITQLYNQNQCVTNITVTDTLIINVGQLSYTNPVTYANNITIYPNPANTLVNISFNNITDLTGGNINIVNSLGQQVATTPITLSGTNTTMQLNSWGGTGLYFVQILNAQGIVVDVKKIILQ